MSHFTSKRNMALQQAINERNCNEVKILIAGGADINHTVNKYLDTMLHKAKCGGIACDLLGYSAKVNAKNIFKQTPLHSAAMAGKDDVVKALIDHVANMDARDSKGHTPLYYAVKSKSVGAIKHLVLNEATGQYRPMFGGAQLSPLYCAMLQDDLKSVKALIKYMVLSRCGNSCSEVLCHKSVDLRVYYRMKNFPLAHSYKNDCVREISKMKQEKLNEKATLFEIVKTHFFPLDSLYKDTESMHLFTRRAFEIIAGNDYPQYHDVIIEKLRSKLQLASLKKMLSLVKISSVGTTSNEIGQMTLNQDINALLGKYLTKIDLFNLILASIDPTKCPMKPTEPVLKRTLGSSSSLSAALPLKKRLKLTNYQC